MWMDAVGLKACLYKNVHIFFKECPLRNVDGNGAKIVRDCMSVGGKGS